ncbi:MAG: hypothetical protein M4D80_34250 [Myxococcota bacterium]|nr:hypothetical protein [Deltaproteobacteria bacterium]MDQ3340248.1 hypothetical protein [Myxococcota bacterium]
MRSVIWAITLSLVTVSIAEATPEGEAIEALQIGRGDLAGGRKYLRDERSAFPKAVEAARACLERLEAVFGARPELHAVTVGDKVTYASLRADCEQLERDAKRAVQSAASEGLATWKQRLVYTGAEGFPSATKWLADARKHRKAKRSVDALEAYSYAVAGFDSARSALAKALEEVPEVARHPLSQGKGKPTISVQALLESATKLHAEAKSEHDSIKQQAFADDDAAEAVMLGSLSGDRKTVAGELGFPSWYEGANAVGSDRRAKALASSPYWRYDSSSGCRVTVHFKANKRTRTVQQPPGCND